MDKIGPVLYIDDEEANLEVFKYNLQKKFCIHTALRASDGLEIIKNNNIKVVLSDQRMPGKTGVEFFEEIAISHPHIIRIILTAFTETKTILDSINKGKVYQYIIKPWNADDLEIAIKNAIEAFDLKRENQRLIDNLKNSNKFLEESNNQLQEEIKARIQTESALKISENKFRNIFYSSIDLIVITDFDKRILEINSSFNDKMNCSRNEVIGKSFETYLLAEEIKLVDEGLMKLKSGKNISGMELHLKGKNENIPVELNSRIIDYNGSEAVLTIVRNIKERRELENKLLNKIIDTEETEKQRFAEELHDGLGPLLSSMKINLHLLEKQNLSEKTKFTLHNITEIVDEAILSIKEISNQLSPYILKDFGLITAIESFCRKINTTEENIQIRIDNKVSDLKLNERHEVVLYRVITELINNTIKHANASGIEITFLLKDTFLMISYKDDGKGFDLNELTESEHRGRGLLNIQNRLKSVNSDFSIITEKDKGFVFNLKLKII